MTNEKKVIIHIGAPKTGSTTLQKFLEDNRQALLSQRWLYPTSITRGFGQHDLAFLLSGAYPEWASTQPFSLDEQIQKLRKEISGHHSPRLLLSSENFYLLCPPKKLALAMESLGFAKSEVAIIIYLRRQDDAHLSWYNQKVKAQGYCGTVKQSISESLDLWDYFTRLSSWTEAFGEECLIVRPYRIDQLKKGDVRSDFLDRLGVESKGFMFSTEKHNTRLNYDIMQFQLRINKLALSISQKRSFHRELVALSAISESNGCFDDPPLLDHSDKVALMARYEIGNKQIMHRFPECKTLFEENICKATDPAGPSYSKLTPEKTSLILAWLEKKCSITKAHQDILSAVSDNHAGKNKNG